MATTTKSEVIEVRPMKIGKAKIKIVGDSPLIVHAWSAKAKREMLWKQLGFPKTSAKEAKKPIEDYVASLYWLTPMPDPITQESVAQAMNDAKFGFGVTAFKQSAITAAYRMGWSKDKASLRGAFYIEPEYNGYWSGDLVPDYDRKTIDIVPNVWHPDSLVEIHGSKPIMKEDMVRLGGLGNPADIRYRGMFEDWWCELTICYNENGQIKLDQIINIFNAGGFACGLGEWRMEKDGNFGAYHVEGV